MKQESRKTAAQGRLIYSAAWIASTLVICNFSRAAVTTATWTGNNSTDFEDPGNWTGGSGGTGTGATGSVVPVAPAPSNTSDVTGNSGDIATFSSNPAIVNNPNLTATRSVQGLLFSTATGGWTLSDTSGSTLTVGGNGISTVGQTSGTDTLAATIALNRTQTIVAGNGGTLLFSGVLSSGTLAAPLATESIFGSSAATASGTVVLNPGAASDNFYSTSATLPTVAAASGMLKLGLPGAGTTSTNVISNSAAFAGLGTTTAAGYIQVNSGTWQTNDLGGGVINSNTGVIEIASGTLMVGGARNIANFGSTGGGVAVVDGGSLLVTNGGFTQTNDYSLEIGNTLATGANGRTAQVNVTSGLLDVAKSGAGSQIGNNSNVYTLMNQDGGTVRFGVSASTNVFTGAATSYTSGNLTIGPSKTSSFNAYTLTGGKLLVNGTLAGAAAATGQIDNFNLMGGQLSAATINVSQLGSNSAATFTGSGISATGANQATVGNNLGVLENYGAVVAPGDIGTAGRTVLTGAYVGNGSGSTLAFDIGGTTQATGFQNGTYDLFAISGTAFLNDQLQVSLTNSFTPSASTVFTVLTSTGLSGAFNNVAFGGTGVTTDGSYDFTVNQAGNNVTLTNFTAVSAPEPASIGLITLAAATMLRRQRANGTDRLV